MRGVGLALAIVVVLVAITAIVQSATAITAPAAPDLGQLTFAGAQATAPITTRELSPTTLARGPTDNDLAILATSGEQAALEIVAAQDQTLTHGERAVVAEARSTKMQVSQGWTYVAPMLA